ncbi:hypothetical protein DACRYDRAFT_104841 [Dacryopinax primogenitus]|uniref:Thioesterase/thiol ester dehydrase-isomerase n=1 Tax=Dacryopinax primogenitus (strain DJM 731) TaxID=1858805 RepID=M5GDZ3_DACPD|nr:uncharacterized protein DACRYDRAFT_104841 [Dacryopinax primogenitus]EJU04947.1 hypothetical protein DACRYDRAFT_104841 [Dacryopinax primogenitus]
MQGLATPDDCDMFGHMSNSSYAKTLDIMRMQFGADFFLTWFSSYKGTCPMGAADYSFIKEIPIMGRYEIRSTIGGWDHKWLCVVSYFVSYPKIRQSGSPEQVLTPPAPLPAALFPPNAILHTVCISRMCFKQRRLTVPPAIAMSLSGMGGSESLGRVRWERVQLLNAEGRMKKMLRTGEWKDELCRPGKEGGWGMDEMEEERKMGMEACGKTYAGMELLRPVTVLDV